MLYIHTVQRSNKKMMGVAKPYKWLSSRVELPLISNLISQNGLVFDRSVARIMQNHACAAAVDY